MVKQEYLLYIYTLIHWYIHIASQSARQHVPSRSVVLPPLLQSAAPLGTGARPCCHGDTSQPGPAELGLGCCSDGQLDSGRASACGSCWSFGLMWRPGVMVIQTPERKLVPEGSDWEDGVPFLALSWFVLFLLEAERQGFRFMSLKESFSLA